MSGDNQAPWIMMLTTLVLCLALIDYRILVISTIYSNINSVWNNDSKCQKIGKMDKFLLWRYDWSIVCHHKSILCFWYHNVALSLLFSSMTCLSARYLVFWFEFFALLVLTQMFCFFACVFRNFNIIHLGRYSRWVWYAMWIDT